MEIISLEIEDFRQFYGKHQLEFGRGGKNTTIILGANGNGKTGIFRAVMFALYGDMSLDQDNNSKDPILVNLDKLEENLHLPVEARVKLNFQHKDILYVIERKVPMIKEGKNTFKTEVTLTDFYKVGSSGDFEKISEDVDLYINDILHKDIREFFFFDAEKMELLNNTRSQRKMTQEVKEGIVKLLQIKSLDDSEQLLKSLIDQENRKITAKAKDSNVNEKDNEKNRLTELVKNLEEENLIIASDREQALREIEQHQQALSSNEKIRELQDEKERSVASLQDSIELFSEQKNHIQKMISQASNLLAVDFLEAKELEIKEIKDSQKDTVPLDMIESSLVHEECQLCGQGMPHESHAYLRLQEVEKNYSFSDVTPIVSGIQTTTQKLKRSELNLKTDMDSYIKKIVKTEEDIDKKELAIRKIDEAIKGKAELLENLKEIEQKLSQHKNNEEKLKEQKLLNELEIKNSEQSIIQLEREIQVLTMKHQDLRIETRMVEKLREMREILSEIGSHYTLEIIDQLSAEMTRTFRSLLGEKDKPIFEKVVINEQYEISVLDKVGNNRVQELSMGQGQIFTLAFITTLAKLASKGREEINFPLFMDTPFGRISGENRDNLIKQIPEVTNQWILLLTDTELTRVEQEAFERHQKVGQVYELINQNGRTIIDEKQNIMNLKVRG